MTSTSGSAPHDGSDLEALRDQIDRLQAVPAEELLEPLPKTVREREATPEPTDAIGSEKWAAPAEDESLDQE